MSFFLICIFQTGSLVAQVTLTGTVLDNDGLPLTGANVFIKGTYDGASTDTSGHFRFRTTATGKQILSASFIGFSMAEKEIDLSVPVDPVQIRMDLQPGEINPVMVTAGAFETGDLKRPIVLKPMDIATTPSAVGDIYGTLTTLPGTQFVGDEGGLYVRGGEGYETKTFIDGMQVERPFLSKMPDLPTRSRFSPVLFKGTAFSTGGFSAEYGDALSSVINLNTVGLAEETKSGFMIMSVGANVSHSQRWKRGSAAGTLQYINMKPYYSLFKQNMEWEKDPVQSDGTLLIRQQRGKYGILKIFGTFNLSKSALLYSYGGDTAGASHIGLQNRNYYVNAIYSDVLSRNWTIKAGLAGTGDFTRTGINTDRLDENLKGIHQRVTLTGEWNDKVSLKIGEEASWYSLNRNYMAVGLEQQYHTGLTIQDYALYLEPEISLNNHLVFRPGLRSEYSSLNDQWNLMPRFSLAYRITGYSQVSLAYGLFRQRPENQYLLYNDDLEPEKATHFILNYQYEANDRIFRVELYRKWYDNLVKYASEYNPDPFTYNNQGSGYAQGIDLFWRDSKTVKNLDYWISYSYIDTKRNYRNFRKELVPSFVSPHMLSVVMKYFFSRANTFAGLTYMHASPKTCYNPAVAVTSGDQTKAYNDLSANILIIRPFLKSYCAILLNVNNVFGFNNVFGYNYPTGPDAGGNYTRYPIKPQSKRFFMLGFLVNL